MDEFQIENVLKDFYENEHFFSQEDFLYFAETDEDEIILNNTFCNDSRFILISDEYLIKKYFISTKTLFKWFCRLSLKLAKSKTFRLSQKQLYISFSFLCKNERFNYLPSNLVSFGKHYGFIDEDPYNNEQYIFPIVYILLFMNGTKPNRVINRIIEKTSSSKTIKNIKFEYLCEIFFEEGLLNLRDRESYIIKSREGLLTGNKLTLNEIGIIKNITRERVRQIEKRAWKKLTHNSLSDIFAAALICKIISKQGSLIYSKNSYEALLISFLAKCSKVPILNCQHINKLILGDHLKNYCNFEASFQITKYVNSQSFFEQLNSDKSICLIKKDLQNLSIAISEYCKTKLTKEQKVYLVLKEIGKPAHFSRIAEVYNSLFPHNPSIERNIHSVLSREKNGVVWIGIRGTYALKEWGYEHPSDTLFETVKEIVQNKYKEINKPVPFNVIVAEISKYRRIINKNSLVIASHCNSYLERIGRDSFIPKESKEKSNKGGFSV
ncbi:MAG: RNA polymerase sigma factor [Parcubacteria bacterium 32_520]|nr:MAG: RNA polymerase sigma factor [Parcubacteria bacterium 32_520]